MRRRGGGGGGGGVELISLDGLRVDGRRPGEVRKIRCRVGVLDGGARSADGSAYLEQGNTKVIAAVYGPRENKASTGTEMAIGCEFSVGNFAGGERRRQRKGDRASTEIAVSIRKTFETVVLVKQHPRSRIDIVVQVLQSDGGQRAAAINAVSLALVNAGIPMRDMICACSIGCVNDEYLVDLNSVEASGNSSQLDVAILAQTGSISFIDMDSRVQSSEQFQHMLGKAMDGCRQISEVMSQEVRSHTTQLVASRGTVIF